MAQRDVPPLMAGLGALIMRLRKDHGLSQSDLAQKAHISMKRVGEIERGAPDLRIMTAVRIAEALGVPPYSLFAPEGFVPPSADPTLLRNYQRAYEAITEVGRSLGITMAASSGAPSLAERPPRQPRRARRRPNSRASD